MARPKQISDADLYRAAQRIYQLRGHHNFTLSELAREVNLSRAAIIQRLEGAEALKLALSADALSLFEGALRELPSTRDGNSLLSLATFIGSTLSERTQLASFLQNFQADLADEHLAELDERRTAALFDAVSQRMPKIAVAHESAVQAFVAHLGGTLLQWQVLSETVSAKDFMIERTKIWLQIAGIPLDAEAQSQQEKQANATEK
jgi:TetR/AcrR family macrolide resistance operon transcriptional repressor